MLCRDFQTVVFDYTYANSISLSRHAEASVADMYARSWFCRYVTRTGLQYRFWSQAVQTSGQKQFFSFRFNIPVQ
jgi:hypothetical protein